MSRPKTANYKYISTGDESESPKIRPQILLVLILSTKDRVALERYSTDPSSSSCKRLCQARVFETSSERVSDPYFDTVILSETSRRTDYL